jgi:hypothetical protein
MSFAPSSGQRHKPDPLPEAVLVVQPDSVALRRLIKEVELGEEINRESYNRTYHRHNR